MVITLPTIKVAAISGIILMMGGISLGISLVYCSPTIAGISKDFHLSSMEETWLNVCGLLCAIFAAPATDFFLVSHIGRRYSGLIAAIIAFVTFFGLSAAKAKWLLFFMRCINGATIGCFSTVCPVYLVEIAPAKYVGLFGYINQIGLALGFLLPTIFGTFANWRQITMLCSIPAGIMILGILFVPEKPANDGAKTSCGMVFKFPKQLILGVCLMFFLQFSGINALLSNLETIINKAKINVDTSLIALIANITQIVATVLASFLVDRWGRRVCWLISTIGQLISFVLLTLQQQLNLPGWVFMVGLFAEQLTYGIGTGPIPFLVATELFEVEIRSTAMSLMTGSNWLLSFAVCFLFPVLEKGIGIGYSFLFFAGISLLAIIFGLFFIHDVTRIDNVIKENSSDTSSDTGPQVTRRLSTARAEDTEL